MTNEIGARHSIQLDGSGRVVGFTAPKQAGSITLAHGFDVAVYTKPDWLHRWAMRLAFGWKWRDA